MIFTHHYERNIIGKRCNVFLSNQHSYAGEIEDFGADWIRINGVDFNADHIVSIRIFDEEKDDR